VGNATRLPYPDDSLDVVLSLEAISHYLRYEPFLQEMVMERLFNPFTLARELTERGFDVRLRGYWGGAGGSRIVRFADAVLRSASTITMPIARAFRIVPYKS
jgi:hypothetical protein